MAGSSNNARKLRVASARYNSNVTKRGQITPPDQNKKEKPPIARTSSSSSSSSLSAQRYCRSSTRPHDHSSNSPSSQAVPSAVGEHRSASLLRRGFGAPLGARADQSGSALAPGTPACETAPIGIHDTTVLAVAGDDSC
eukprot:CAMPEP_0119406006 /NCGR_PEP_ID=MMETSP1335-20130426/503_1 /TAXON_ID=259385 /ORGANISM="Chrysoculter rhomboideus, Strain RCC1486" /LENGTH=138 /DNA_ID=CAMNT_0007430061 /DNA_START=15 /DNA_END=433 /DNA_ORIENTATION=+